MNEVRCNYCGGLVCKTNSTEPIEAACSSCHKIRFYDGTNSPDRARVMDKEELKRVKRAFHEILRAKKAAK